MQRFYDKMVFHVANVDRRHSQHMEYRFSRHCHPTENNTAAHWRVVKISDWDCPVLVCRLDITCRCSLY